MIMWKARMIILDSLKGKSFQTFSSQSRYSSSTKYNILKKIVHLQKHNTNLKQTIITLENKNTELENKNTELENKNTELENKNTKLENDSKDKNRLLKILYVGELARNTRLQIRMTICDKDKIKDTKITSLLHFDRLTHKYLTQNEIRKWQCFRQSIQNSNIDLNKIDDAINLSIKWRNTVAHPKRFPLELPVNKDQID